LAHPINRIIIPPHCAVQASLKVKASQDNVAGVRLPKFESVKEGQDSKLGLIGLGTGGKQIQECRCALRAGEGYTAGPRQRGRGGQVGKALGCSGRWAGWLGLHQVRPTEMLCALLPQVLTAALPAVASVP